MEYLGFSIYNIASSRSSDNFTSSFLFWMPMIPFSCLIGKGFPTLCWIKSGRNGHSYLVSHLRGNTFNFFAFEYDVICGLAICDHCDVEIYSLCTCFVERIYHKWMLNFSNASLHPVKWWYDFYPLLCYHDMLHLITVYDLFISLKKRTYLWIGVLCYLPGFSLIILK